MSRQGIEEGAPRRTYAIWLFAVAFTSAAGALIFIVHIPRASQQSQGGFYALTAAAQALAAVLGLVLATAAVVAQLRALFSRRTLGIGSFREIFGWETIAMVVLYGIVIWLQLAVVSTGRVERWEVRCLLLASAACLSALAPYLVRLGRRLSPGFSLDQVTKKLVDSPALGLKLIADVEDFALTAVGQHDYATIRSSVSTLKNVLELGMTSQGPASSKAAAEALQTLALVGAQDPLTVSIVLAALRDTAEALCEEDLDRARAATAGRICTVASRIADRAVLDQAASDAAACADVLGMLGEELARSGWSAESAIAVGGLFMLKVSCANERLQDISGIAARHLARIRPGASPEQPWPRRGRAVAPANLLLNASFEFGHDYGYGLEPGWHRGPFAQSMWMKAATYYEGERGGQQFLRAVADRRNQSIAQDVCERAEPGESFVAVCRAASADNAALRGRFALWALGAPGERGEVIYELPPASQAGGSASSAAEESVRWRVLRAPLDVRAGGHETLRAEIYIDESVVEEHGQKTIEPRGKLLLDDVAMVRANLSNASFELQTLEPWMQESLGNDGRCTLCRHGDHRTPLELGGDWYVRMDPRRSSLALRQRTKLSRSGGRTYELLAAIRSASERLVSVSLEIDVDREQIATATFAAGPAWRTVHLPFAFDVTHEPLDDVTCDIVIAVDADVADIDAVAIVPTLLFDTYLSGHEHWKHSPSTLICQGGTRLSDYGNVRSVTVNAEGARAALWQDIAVAPRVGDSYRLAVRGRPSCDSAPVTVTIIAKDKVGRDLASASTHSVLTDKGSWATLSVPFDCQRGDIDTLRALLEVERGASAELVGVTFNPLVIANSG